MHCVRSFRYRPSIGHGPVTSQDMLGQGQRLDRMTEMSANLSNDSKRYHKRSKDMYMQALYRKYMPFIVVGGVIVFVLFIRWKLYS